MTAIRVPSRPPGACARSSRTSARSANGYNHPLRDATLGAEHGAPERFEDCYLFVGDPGHADTDLSDHWNRSAAGQMLERLKARTARMPEVVTVTKPVNVHNFCHWAYTKSKGLPIDEDDRRKVFGWRPGSDTGEETYGHTTTAEAAERFVAAWRDRYGDAEGIKGVAEAVVGSAAAGNLSPEAKRALMAELVGDDELKRELASELAAVLAEAG